MISIGKRENEKKSSRMEKCPYCSEGIRPVRDESTTPKEGGEGVSGGMWISPVWETIRSVSVIDVL